MGRPSPFVVALSDEDRRELERRVRGGRVEHRTVLRAQIVLFASDGGRNVEIARRLGIALNTVSKWRKRFATGGLAGLADHERSGRPKSFSASVVAGVTAVACELPAKRNLPLSRFSCAEIAAEVVRSKITDRISASTIRRILADAVIRPWRYRSWIFPRDPRFAEKAGIVLDLYERIFDGAELADDEYVISTDEKTSIQARCRCHPSLPPGRSRMLRVEHEYKRKGALNYLAALDVHRATLLGRCEDKTGIVAFERLVADLMATEPYASARRVLVVCDNGSSHRGQASIDRTKAKWPTVQLVHVPIHASWLNQIEIVFSILQRKILTPNDCRDLDEVTMRIAGFEQSFNERGEPFHWRFTRSDLELFLKKLEVHKDLPTGRAAA
jgi:transposase